MPFGLIREAFFLYGNFMFSNEMSIIDLMIFMNMYLLTIICKDSIKLTSFSFS
ncbi:hypothetical protein HNQ88_002486 [Aureibacter tunicatorum]|uniref:Uncharacterized protein n=1 Tax=Aureibacter tunicatorum TaxID=866807 RepID=A0AAE3XQD4_9BACT|nr:hypothetical protein [Aureibacter tunicatorum]BDD04628.1 hypothetical protein AUTU_21110 [Aureibacter tunicatorum]